jgi:FKBP-type peptidyl-prolyl cis-trans isomerase
VKTASGLIFKSVSPGSGASPKPTDTVAVNYRGTLIDGTEFDASAKHGGPATFRLNGVIPCWTEAVGRMKVGEKAHIVCPSEIAYGDRVPPGGPIPPGATLLFDVELLAINPKTAPAPGR